MKTRPHDPKSAKLMMLMLTGLLVLTGALARAGDEDAASAGTTSMTSRDGSGLGAHVNTVGDRAAGNLPWDQPEPAASFTPSNPAETAKPPIDPLAALPRKVRIAGDTCADLGECDCPKSPECRPLTEPCYCAFPQCGNGACICAGGRYLGCVAR